MSRAKGVIVFVLGLFGPIWDVNAKFGKFDFWDVNLGGKCCFFLWGGDE